MPLIWTIWTTAKENGFNYGSTTTTNHMIDKRKISDCIDDLNVAIGPHHDWCKSSSDVNRNMTKDTKK